MDLDAVGCDTVAELKGAIAQRWGIPVRCQRLLLGDVVLQDDERLAGHQAEGSPVAVTMVTCLEDVRRDLEGSAVLRRGAVRALAMPKMLSQDAVLDMLTACLDDPDEDVRLSVPFALAAGGRGDARTRAALAPYLEHWSGDVRRAAVVSLGCVAEVGNERDIDSMAGLLLDRDAAVREAALVALGAIARKADEQLLCTVRSLVEHDWDWGVRTAAAHALSRLASPGDRASIEVLIRCLWDQDKDVREAMVEALTILVPEDMVLAGAAERAGWDACIYQAVAQALHRFAKRKTRRPFEGRVISL